MNGCVYREIGFADICKLYTVNGDTSYCSDDFLKTCEDCVPSNLDLVRAMNDDDLTEFIANKRCPGGHMKRDCKPWSSCKECWKAWLHSPSKEVKK